MTRQTIVPCKKCNFYPCLCRKIKEENYNKLLLVIRDIAKDSYCTREDAYAYHCWQEKCLRK